MCYRNLYADQVNTFLSQPNAVALDVRDINSYKRGHLSGAEHADAMSMGKLIQSHKQESPILVYCYHGALSRSFAQLVHRLGFENVYHLEGGYHSWAQVSSA